MAKQNAPEGDLFDRLIIKFQEDQEALIEQDELINKARSYRGEILTRLKEMKRDFSTMVKYATPEQKAKIESFNLDLSEGSSSPRGGTLNPITACALTILTQAEGQKMTNGELYGEYLNTVKDNEDAEDYTQFNIKLRQLFDRGLAIKEQIDPNKKNRDDMITLVKMPEK